jgi:endonuclease III
MTKSSKISLLKEKKQEIQKILAQLSRAVRLVDEPLVFQLIKREGRDPYLILVACLLSLRARDVMTARVVTRLFARVRTPQELLQIPVVALEALLKPLGMFRRKAAVLRSVSQQLIEHHQEKVPVTEKELLAIPGIGRKTAHLVLGVAFGKPAVCVDVHVHRIANRLGWVQTKTPEQTERALMKLVPRAQWTEINRLLVAWGQHHCRPSAAGMCKTGCPFEGLCSLVWQKLKKN